MADERFLVVRLSSLGDIVHNLPAVSTLRDSFPEARIDWLVDRKWTALLDGNLDLDEVIELDRGSWTGLCACMRRLRARHYTCAIDFQGLYKSAVLSLSSGARSRVGFGREMAREPGAAFFYTRRILPTSGHKVDHNIALVEAAGARRTVYRFPLRVSPRAEADLDVQLALSGLREFLVVSPGGGWRSKCWPPERYGRLCCTLEQGLGWRAVVNFAPQERELADAVCRSAAPAHPVLLATDIPELMALLSRARLVVGGDTGPLHLAVALGTPVVGLYGPTDPARNGPFGAADAVVRNAQPSETTYKRHDAYSPAMLSISVEQVVRAVEKRLGAPG